MLEGAYEVMGNLGIARGCLSTLYGRFENVPLLLVLPEIDAGVVKLDELVEGIHLISNIFLLCAPFFFSSYTISFP